MDRRGGRFSCRCVICLPCARWTLAALLSVVAVFGGRSSAKAAEYVVTEVADINPGEDTPPCLIEPWLCGPPPPPTPRNGSPNGFTPLGDRLYCAANDLTGSRLYQTDGTSVAPVGTIQGPSELTRFGD